MFPFPVTPPPAPAQAPPPLGSKGNPHKHWSDRQPLAPAAPKKP